MIRRVEHKESGNRSAEGGREALRRRRGAFGRAACPTPPSPTPRRGPRGDRRWLEALQLPRKIVRPTSLPQSLAPSTLRPI